MEVWKDITGYEGLYQISNYGQVKSLHYHRGASEKIMALKTMRGYKLIGLRKNGVKKIFQVHRLVAKAFIANPYNLEQVNHKDTNKANNHVDNLEWVTARENSLHAIRHGRFKGSLENLKLANERRKMRVIAVDKTGNEQLFESMHEAARLLDISRKYIKDCLDGKYKCAKGICFRYA